MLRCLQVGALAFLLTAPVVASQVPAGYHLGARVVLPDSLVEVSAGGRFRATIRRIARSQHEHDLLTLAERLYPDSATLLGVARDQKQREELLTFASGVALKAYKIPQRSAGIPKDRWWLDAFDATWLPYAVTGGAADYYLWRLRDLAAGRSPFVVAPRELSDKGSFAYEATVRTTTEVDATHIVELRMSWDYWCGPLCAMSFVHCRQVWFDKRGNILRVTGDGRPVVIVS